MLGWKCIGKGLDSVREENGMYCGKVTECIRVVSAIIEKQGHYLITQRSRHGPLAGLWEFPGGKVDPGESDEAALKREVFERVGVDVAVKRWRANRTHHYAGYSVDLVLYEASILLDQEPRVVRAADFRWVTAQELDQYPFPPADQATTDLLFGFGHSLPDEASAGEALLVREID